MTIVDLIWLGVGVGGQICFLTRVVWQVLVSDRGLVGRPYWWLSLLGGMSLLVYAVHLADPIFSVGQGIAVLFYLRGLRSCAGPLQPRVRVRLTQESQVEPCEAELVGCDLSLVCSAHDEGASLGELVDEWDRALRGLRCSYEMIIVNDGSHDHSSAVLRQAMARHYPRLRVFEFTRRRGESAALAAGLVAARGVWIVTTDADRSYDPADLVRMMALRHRYDMICGWRRDRGDRPHRRAQRVAERILDSLRQRILNDPLHDSTCGLKLMSSQCIAGTIMFDGMHRLLPALARMEGFRVTELPVAYRSRGEPRARRFELLRALEDLLAITWYARRRIHHLQPREVKLTGFAPSDDLADAA